MVGELSCGHMSQAGEPMLLNLAVSITVQAMAAAAPPSLNTVKRKFSL